MKNRSKLRSALLIVLFACLVAVNGYQLITQNSSSRRFYTVPNYDLMVRDVKNGDIRMRVPEEAVLPETDPYYLVSYKGSLTRGKGEAYSIDPHDVQWGYSIRCIPEDGYGAFPVDPNTSILGTNVEFSTIQSPYTGTWAQSIAFKLDGYLYQVRYTSESRPGDEVQPALTAVAASIVAQ